MDFLDYREKLGIGCCDGEKFTFFLTKIFNFLNLAAILQSPQIIITLM